MKPRTIRENVYLIGAVDWDRRLFDALIPLPDGTSYNAYFVAGQREERPHRHRRPGAVRHAAGASSTSCRRPTTS